MRRLKLSLALSLLASVLYAPAADAALSAGNGPGAIVSGVLADATDNPVAGNVELYAWPTGRPVAVGQTLQLLPVGADRVAKDGLFSITGDLTPDLAELARLNGGYINFVLQGAAAGVVEETHFSATSATRRSPPKKPDGLSARSSGGHPRRSLPNPFGSKSKAPRTTTRYQATGPSARCRAAAGATG